MREGLTMHLSHKRKMVLLIFAVSALILTAVGCETPSVDGAQGALNAEPTAVPTAEVETIALSHGTFSADAETLTVVVESSDLALLDAFTNLKAADFSGSTSYDAILAYEKAHPKVEVRYTVALGDTTVASDATSVTVEAPLDAETLRTQCGYLPHLSALDVRACSYDVETLRSLLAALPDVTLSYVVSCGGATYDSDVTTLDLSNRSGEAALALADVLDLLPQLTYVNLTNPETAAGEVTCDITLEQLAVLQAKRPDVAFDYRFTLLGKQFSTADTAMDLVDVYVGKPHIDEVRGWLPYMTVCTLLDMDGCRVANETMAQLRDDFPNIKVVWRVYFARYSCRTDAVVLRASTGTPRLTSSQMQVLQYCTDMEMLDLGHNFQKDLSFVSYMPNLRVAILAMGYVKDLTPLTNCPHLEYLELFTNFIEDVSPLAELKELEHLNLAYNRITDISPLYGMTQLKRLWIARNDIPEEQIQTLIASLPNTEIDYTSHNPTGGTWRHGERYTLLGEQFRYDYHRWFFE